METLPNIAMRERSETCCNRPENAERMTQIANTRHISKE
jgi:hypothetical protein